MSDSPDPTIVRTEETIVVDFATPLKVTKVATVFYAYDEGCDDTGIYGDGYFAHFDDALWATARTYANEEYGLYRTPPKPLTWRKHHHLWRLHDGNNPTDIVVSDSPLLGSKPAEQPQDDGDVRAVADAVVRLKAWLTGRQANVHSEISTTNVIAEPRDRSTAAWAIAESDVRSVVVALEARDAKTGEQR